VSGEWILDTGYWILDASTFAEASNLAYTSSFANATEDRTPDKSADKSHGFCLATKKHKRILIVDCGFTLPFFGLAEGEKRGVGQKTGCPHYSIHCAKKQGTTCQGISFLSASKIFIFFKTFSPDRCSRRASNRSCRNCSLLKECIAFW